MIKSAATMRTDEPAEERLRRATELVDDRADRQAVEILEPLAEVGNAAAQTLLGWLHENGRGLAKDVSRAKQLYRSAAETEHVVAQFYLARLHQHENDHASALPWLERAHAHQFAPASFRLALHHLRNGDEATAEALLRWADSNGHLLARARIARLRLRSSKRPVVWAKALVTLFVTIARIIVIAAKDPGDVRVLS